ncbi:MAG: T9SS type A sorting domain-containing protein [Candidatus Kapabacteria bacterium]|nr:T9SS type A sorting domain-containing protein [Candidatus Kapabacteria bacterium]
MKSLFLSLALLIAGYTSSFADNYFQDTIWMKKTDQSNGFYMLKFSKNDSIIAGFGYQKTIFYEAKTGNEIARIDGNKYGFFINNDTRFIRINNTRTGIEIIDMKTLKVVDTLESDGKSFGEFADITDDGKYIVAIVQGGFNIWDIESKKIIKSYTSKSEENLIKITANQISFSKIDNQVLISLDKTYNISNSSPPKTKTISQIIVYGFENLDSLKSFSTYSNFSISKTNKYIAIKTSDNKNGVEIYDFASKQLLHKLPVNGLNVTGMEFSSDEKYLVTTSGPDDNKLIVWDVVTGKTIKSNNDGSYDNFVISHKQTNLACSMGRSLILNKSPFNQTSVSENIDNIPILYPNPTNGIVNINLQSPILGVVKIQITNVNGNVLLNISDIIPQNNMISLNIAQLSIGTYFLNLSSNNFHQTYKLIKE